MKNSQATIIGNLTADPKLAYTTAGTAVANGTIAVNHRFQQAGQWTERTSFVKWAAFGQQAENIAQSVTKGSQVVAVGHLETDTYTTKTGDERSELQLMVDHMAVSLMFATVQIERVARSQPAGRQSRSTTSSAEPEDDF